MSSVMRAKNIASDREMGKNAELLHYHVPDTALGTLHASSPLFFGARVVVRQQYSHFPAEEN